MQEKICRICHSAANDDQNDPLRTPCKCTGSVRYVHTTCLQQWLTAKRDQKCEMCNYSYKFIKIYTKDTPDKLLSLAIVKALFNRMKANFLKGFAIGTLLFMRIISTLLVSLFFTLFFSPTNIHSKEFVVFNAPVLSIVFFVIDVIIENVKNRIRVIEINNSNSAVDNLADNNEVDSLVDSNQVLVGNNEVNNSNILSTLNNTRINYYTDLFTTQNSINLETRIESPFETVPHNYELPLLERVTDELKSNVKRVLKRMTYVILWKLVCVPIGLLRRTPLRVAFVTAYGLEEVLSIGAGLLLGFVLLYTVTKSKVIKVLLVFYYEFIFSSILLSTLFNFLLFSLLNLKCSFYSSPLLNNSFLVGLNLKLVIVTSSGFLLTILFSLLVSFLKKTYRPGALFFFHFSDNFDIINHLLRKNLLRSFLSRLCVTISFFLVFFISLLLHRNIVLGIRLDKLRIYFTFLVFVISDFRAFLSVNSFFVNRLLRFAAWLFDCYDYFYYECERVVDSCSCSCECSCDEVVDNNQTVVNDQTQSVVNENSVVVNDQAQFVVNENSVVVNDNSVVVNDQTESVVNDDSVVLNDKTESVVNDQTESVVNDQTQSVVNDQTVSNDNNQTQFVVNENSVVVNDQTESVVNDQTESVVNDNSVVVNDQSVSNDNKLRWVPCNEEFYSKKEVALVYKTERIPDCLKRRYVRIYTPNGLLPRAVGMHVFVFFVLQFVVTLISFCTVKLVDVFSLNLPADVCSVLVLSAFVFVLNFLRVVFFNLYSQFLKSLIFLFFRVCVWPSLGTVVVLHTLNVQRALFGEPFVVIDCVDTFFFVLLVVHFICFVFKLFCPAFEVVGAVQLVHRLVVLTFLNLIFVVVFVLYEGFFCKRLGSAYVSKYYLFVFFSFLFLPIVVYFVVCFFKSVVHFVFNLRDELFLERRDAIDYDGDE